MANRITLETLKASAEQVNRILAELGVDIDASIDAAYGRVKLVGFNGSQDFSSRMTKSELFYAIKTVQDVLYEVSRQSRQLDKTCVIKVR